MGSCAAFINHLQQLVVALYVLPNIHTMHTFFKISKRTYTNKRVFCSFQGDLSLLRQGPKDGLYCHTC